MAAKTRLSSEERRNSIVEAAIPVFAQKGFNGTTTKELAAAAGISEALMYKHFPSKKDLYLKIQEFCCEDKDDDLARLEILPDSTHSLVICFYLFLKRVLDDDTDSLRSLNRLMLSSLLDDGEFARVFLQNTCSRWRAKMITCLKASAANNEIDMLIDEHYLNIWIFHHMAIAALVFRTPQEPVIDYGVDNTKLIDTMMTFGLRGLGMAPELIKEIYKKEELEKLIEL